MLFTTQDNVNTTIDEENDPNFKDSINQINN